MKSMALFLVFSFAVIQCKTAQAAASQPLTTKDCKKIADKVFDTCWNNYIMEGFSAEEHRLADCTAKYQKSLNKCLGLLDGPLLFHLPE